MIAQVQDIVSLCITPQQSRKDPGSWLSRLCNHEQSCFPCRIKIMTHFYSAGSGFSYMLHPLPFVYKVNVTAQDYNKWSTFNFEFCGQVDICQL